jgi:COX assembly mitochondrial protein 2
MHPPLDRPHPDCQNEIKSLRRCHATRPLWKIWACNDIKQALDVCFRLEKEKMLAERRKALLTTREADEAIIVEAMGKNMSFEDFLKQETKSPSEFNKTNCNQN